MQERRCQLLANGRCPLKKKYDYNLVCVRFSAPPHFSLYSNYDARVHLHPLFWANIRVLLLFPLRCYVELELFWVTGFVYQISSSPSPPQLPNTAGTAAPLLCHPIPQRPAPGGEDLVGLRAAHSTSPSPGKEFLQRSSHNVRGQASSKASTNVMGEPTKLQWNRKSLTVWATGNLENFTSNLTECRLNQHRIKYKFISANY